jgi:hypothetical protein
VLSWIASSEKPGPWVVSIKYKKKHTGAHTDFLVIKKILENGNDVLYTCNAASPKINSVADAKRHLATNPLEGILDLVQLPKHVPVFLPDVDFDKVKVALEKKKKGEALN